MTLYPPPQPPTTRWLAALFRYFMSADDSGPLQIPMQSILYFNVTGPIDPFFIQVELEPTWRNFFVQPLTTILAGETILYEVQWYFQSEYGLGADYEIYNYVGTLDPTPAPSFSNLLVKKFTTSEESDRPGRFWIPGWPLSSLDGRQLDFAYLNNVQAIVDAWVGGFDVDTFHITPAIFSPLNGTLVNLDHFTVNQSPGILHRRSAFKASYKLPFNEYDQEWF